MPDWSRYEFDWNRTDADYIIDEHSVYPVEVEQVFANRPQVVRRGDLYHAF